MGSIGETISGIAVVISLVYLSFQIRDNTKTMRASSKKDVFMWWSEWCREMSCHPHAVLHNKSIDPSTSWTDYSFEEQTIIGFLNRAVVARFESEYALYESGMLEPEIWEEHRSFCHSLLQAPTWAEWWKSEMEQSILTKGFVENINSSPVKSIMGPTPFD